MPDHLHQQLCGLLFSLVWRLPKPSTLTLDCRVGRSYPSGLLTTKAPVVDALAPRQHLQFFRDDITAYITCRPQHVPNQPIAECQE